MLNKALIRAGSLAGTNPGAGRLEGGCGARPRPATGPLGHPRSHVAGAAPFLHNQHRDVEQKRDAQRGEGSLLLAAGDAT